MNLPNVLPVVDFSQGKNLNPIPRDFVLPALPAGKVGILSAPGGTGKSFLLLELGMSVATGEPLIHGLVPGGAGPVRYISFEEDEVDLHNRLTALFKVFEVPPPVETFFPSALEGENLPLVGSGGIVKAEAVRWLESVCEGMRLVILDPLSRLHEADENSNSEMKSVVRTLIATARKTRCTILIAHHTNKGAMLNGQGDMQGSHRGASCLVDDPRLAMTLSRQPKPVPQRSHTRDGGRKFGLEPEGDFGEGERPLVLTWVKVNSHPPVAPVELARVDGGILVAANGMQDRSRNAGGMQYAR